MSADGVPSNMSGPKVSFFGPMKGLDSATWSVETLPTGQLLAKIEHQTMRGVTPAMMRWWFEHIDEFTTWNGSDFSGPRVAHYRLWHPFDHIRVRWPRRVHDADGRLTVGSMIAIEEDLGGIDEVRAKAIITKFDDEAFNFDMMPAGPIRIGHLLHEYAATEDGCSFYTEMLAGFSGPISRLFNPLIRHVLGGEDFVRTWVLHNIEESGETEHILPALHAQAMQGRTDQ